VAVGAKPEQAQGAVALAEVGQAELVAVKDLPHVKDKRSENQHHGASEMIDGVGVLNG
jgi:hypothetical protein